MNMIHLDNIDRARELRDELHAIDNTLREMNAGVSATGYNIEFYSPGRTGFQNVLNLSTGTNPDLVPADQLLKAMRESLWNRRQGVVAQLNELGFTVETDNRPQVVAANG